MFISEVTKENVLAFKPPPHPVIYTPTPEDIAIWIKNKGIDWAVEMLQQREDKIYAEKKDPYRHGYEGSHFLAATELFKADDELLVSGGNRAGKTEWAAKRVAIVLSGCWRD